MTIGHFRIIFDLSFKASPGAHLFIMRASFYLHMNENYFSYERMSTRTRFEKEAKGNSEMVYLWANYHNMTICVLAMHYGNTESRKNFERKFIFHLGTLYPHGINECLSFH